MIKKIINKLIPNSLPVRAWLAVTTVTLLFTLSAISSGFLAWVSQEDAKAVNTAGSIRMATYRLNFLLASGFEYPDFIDLTGSNFDTSLVTDPKQFKQQAISHLIVDMQNRLVQLQLYQSHHNNAYQPIDDQLAAINAQWYNTLKPALSRQDSKQLYAASIPYILHVDALVQQIQIRNEQRQQWQQILQLISLILAVLIMLAGLYELKKKVLKPVNTLIKATKEFQSGNLDTHIPATGYHEFNSLATSFNEMATTIDCYQKSLQNEVQAKTADLTKANKVLSLLYDFAKHLTTNQVSVTELNRLIAEFGKIFPELEFTLCLQNELVNKDAIAIHSSQLQDVCAASTCDHCLIKSSPYTKSYPVRQQNNNYGDLRVRPKNLATHHSKTQANATELQPTNISKNRMRLEAIGKFASRKWLKTSPSKQERITLIEDKQDTLYHDQGLTTESDAAITALTNLISTAMFLLQQRQHEHQIILLEERATIARELHDSLAQSLSYLKIQVSILEKHLQHSSCDNPDLILANESITKIKEGLISAYQHLRDLLVTFRLSLNDDSFDEALHNSAEEFAKKGGFEISVDNHVMSLNLSASEQVNIIQIVREALSNVCRHANASKVEISFKYKPNSNDTILCIADNGVGISGDYDQTHHHGLKIMQERAASLGGSLQLRDNIPTGCIVEATFSPEFFDE